MKINTYSIKGTKSDEISLPKEFSVEKNEKLLAQAIRVYEERSHVGLADTKTRAEINRTKKKWYKQKGTGGARHGAKSAPIFVGGGVAHGPKPIRRILLNSKKMVKQALYQALSIKLTKKEVAAVDGISGFTKTGQVKTFLNKVNKVKRYTFILSPKNFSVKKYLRNIPGVKVVSYDSLNAFEVFFGGMLIFDSGIFKKEEKRTPEKKLSSKTIKK
jgi:large subunit ribosomal protein L4